MWPIPAFRVARAALLLTAKACDPLLPYLCVLDVDTVAFTTKRAVHFKCTGQSTYSFVVTFCEG